ncbi:RnfH family protein [Hydrogenophilus thermoluteolus]|jgi:putative ubiquitin-RnfH superfamily antitoxin RatB of RatAB toxin-antitoxin module|uniref:RnfH family protein n=1 Tax=Hydrogenophilus thermoluteolus TaxID=297 RepID=UPI001C640DFF|nr:RnfH family protein [Hydrogenophilus thermoluteolus]MBW7655747.1 RnfH family protein [Hydrogenophilus thermoluteolus]HNQ47797.1 RnfH family protein [Hydrogenophilus thermoluteolus]HNU19773.1 RnfH family protein [Hydrogenophilus thermoluteolus]
MTETITVEVVYAPAPHQVDLVTVQLPPESTVADALERSGILSRHPEIDLDGKNRIGIYAKPVTLATPLKDRDRIEIYRPIIADPKAARRKKAAQK